MKILIIGDSCKDVFHYGTCTRLCPDAPVPVFKTIDVIKNDGMAKNVQKNLNALGANTNIITNSNWEKITKTRFVDLRTNHMFLRVDENDDSFEEMSEYQFEKIKFKNYDAIIVSDYNKGFLSAEILQKISNSHNTTFIDTKKKLGNWCKNFSFIKINNQEFEATKDSINEELLKKMIITRGSHGAEFQGKMFPVPLVEVKDTCGAGDTFISSLCFRYIQTKNINESINFANNCATKVVQKRGINII